jgi:hypothetical protein
VLSRRPPAVLVVAGIALVLRLAWVLTATRVPVFIESGDAHSYFFYGRQIAAGGGYLNLDGSGHATAYYPIGYPALLGGLFWVVRHLPVHHSDFALTQAATLLNALLGTASVALLWVIVDRVVGRRAATVAATVLALWPNAIAYTATLQLETAFTCAALAALAVVATAVAPWSWRRLVAFSVALGLSALIRPFSLPFLAVPVAVLLLRRPRTPLRVWAVSVAALVVPLVAVLTPWTLRNAHAMGAPLPFSSNLGDTLCLDRNLDAKGGFRFDDHDGCADPSLGEVDRNRISTGKAIDFVREHPGREALQIVRRTRLILGSDHDGLDAVERGGRAPLVSASTGRALRRASDLWFFVALALALAGAAVAATDRRTRRAELLVLALPALSLFATAALLWGTPRFHAPLVPYLAAFAGVALARLRQGGDTPRCS